MGRNISIIMMDFFVVMTIIFFLLLFLEDDRVHKKTKTDFVFIKVALKKDDFYKRKNLLDIKTSELLNIGLVLKTNKGVYEYGKSYRDVKFIPSFDGISVFYSGSSFITLDLLMFAKTIKSIDFVKDDVFVKVNAISPKGLSYKYENKISLLHNPVTTFHIK